jgi:hypothetical protein
MIFSTVAQIVPEPATNSKKPGQETLHARFTVTDGELAAIRGVSKERHSFRVKM